MTVDVEAVAPTVLIAEARVHRAQRLSPAFVRVALESEAFVDLADAELDTRFKMIFPGPTGELPLIPEQPDEWYAQWMSTPDDTRSPMRTYTVRDVVEEDGKRLLVVDLVVHEEGPHGPACAWALAARPGDVIQVIAPHRATDSYGGVEFAPGEAKDLLVIGDETALPAVARILAEWEPGRRGRVFVEVPSADDVLELDQPDSVSVRWVVRDGTEQGRLLVETVRSHLGLAPLDPTVLPADVSSDLDVEVWETPRYSSSGEEIAPTEAPSAADRYAWIAGESWLVKALRRSLVSELGLDRGAVAFMGYWRVGVAMRS